PTLPFKTKNSWAGNIPITGTTVQDATLYFWLWGKDAKDSGDDLVIWLNGGPGCSSLTGMVQENGPFLYLNKNYKPFPNGYSFTRAANVLYVEQPVHTGFTTGITENTNEDEVAAQFASFLANFYKIFPELATKKLWITGESYAGTYIPYIMTYLYQQGQTPQLAGGKINDGSITDQRLQEDVVVYQFSVQHQKALNFTDDDIAQIKAESDKCGLTTFVEQNLNYPPKGRLPGYSDSCQPYDTYYNLANQRNPQFNVYNIDIPSPDPNSPLGYPNSGAAQYLHKTFFDNYDLQTYIHAPHQKWVECAVVFVADKDTSKKPDRQPNFNHSILANIIEKSKNFIIMNGDLDGLLITNGTSLALQNLTWNNAQGFSKPPVTPLYDLEGNQKAVSTHERGLSYATVPGAGHMV
ncbi:alpha/beta-hydrolase, partial [Meira miltonrushii]